MPCAASYPLGLLSSRTMAGCEEEGEDTGPSESAYLRAALAAAADRSSALETTVQRQGAAIARLEARLAALSGLGPRPGSAGSDRGSDGSDAPDLVPEGHRPCAAPGGEGVQADPCGAGEAAATAGGCAAASPSPATRREAPSLAALCSTFKSAAARPQLSIQLHTPRAKPRNLGAESPGVGSYPLTSGKDAGAGIAAHFGTTPRRTGLPSPAKPAVH